MVIRAFEIDAFHSRLFMAYIVCPPCPGSNMGHWSLWCSPWVPGSSRGCFAFPSGQLPDQLCWHHTLAHCPGHCCVTGLHQVVGGHPSSGYLTPPPPPHPWWMSLPRILHSQRTEIKRSKSTWGLEEALPKRRSSCFNYRDLNFPSAQFVSDSWRHQGLGVNA